MTNVLVSRQFIAGFGDELKAVASRAGKNIEFMTLPEAMGARLAQADCDRIACTFIDRDIRFGEQLYPAYGAAVVASTSLKCCAEMFIANFGHWLRGEPMFNVQRVE